MIRLCEIMWMDSTHGCRTRHYYHGHILNTASHSAISHRHLCSNVTAREKGWEGDKVCPRKEKRTFCPKPAGLAWEWNGILVRGDLFTWALSQNTCPRCHNGVWDAVYHRIPTENRWAVSVPVCLLNCLTDKKPSSEIATNVLPHFMVRTEHIFSKGLRKYAIILNHSQENHKPRNKCLFRFRARKRTPVDPR